MIVFDVETKPLAKSGSSSHLRPLRKCDEYKKQNFQIIEWGKYTLDHPSFSKDGLDNPC